MIVLFSRNESSHKFDWNITARCLLCLVLLYVQVISLMKVLEVECTGLCLIKNSIATTLLFVYCVHSAYCCVRILVYPIFSNACCCWFTWNEFDVFVSVAFVYRLMLDNIKLFLLSQQYSSDEFSRRCCIVWFTVIQNRRLHVGVNFYDFFPLLICSPAKI